MRWLSRIVTFVLLAALVVGAVLLVRLALPNQDVGQDFRTYALLRDGSRLAVGSPVMIAGVRVGEIEKLSVEGAFARADLRLRNVTNVPRDSWITKRSTSAFGDSYLEIIPPEDEGAAGAAPLKDGEPMARVIEGGSTDSVLRALGRTMPRVDSALDSLHEFLGNGRHWIDTAMRDRADRADAWLADGKIEAGVATADHAMERLESGTTRAADAVSHAGPSFTHTLDRVDSAIAGARTRIADVKSSLHDGLARVRSGLDDVDQPIADYQEVVSAIDRGSGDDYRGTLGRLINDHELGDTIDEVVEVGRDAAYSIARYKTWLGMRFEYNVFARIPRFYATAEIRGRNDKFYLVELERDPMGGLPSTDLADAAGSPTFTRTIQVRDSLRFTAQWGKQFGPLALRGGLKDSTFGLGGDALVGGGRLRLSLDAFGGVSELPRIKVAAAFAVFRSVYLLAGIDDAFTKPGYLAIENDPQGVPNDFHRLRYGRDYFVGATLHFDDADLATLLRVYGALLVSAL